MNKKDDEDVFKVCKAKKKTYVYLMEYLSVDKREENNYKDREVVKGLGDITDALIQLEIWKIYPDEIPLEIKAVLKKGDLENWVDSIMKQNHIYNIRY